MSDQNLDYDQLELDDHDDDDDDDLNEEIIFDNEEGSNGNPVDLDEEGNNNNNNNINNEDELVGTIMKKSNGQSYQAKKRRWWILVFALIMSVVAILITAYEYIYNDGVINIVPNLHQHDTAVIDDAVDNTNSPVSSSSSSSSSNNSSNYLSMDDLSNEEIEIVKQIQLKLEQQTPHILMPLNNSNTDSNSHTIIQKHQFLHLHQMKTGGTSMDHVIRCARNRLTKDFHLTVPYKSIHECSRRSYKECLLSKTNQCVHDVDSAAVLSYCAPIRDLPHFGWVHDNDYNDYINNNNDIMDDYNDSHNNKKMKKKNNNRHHVDSSISDHTNMNTNINNMNINPKAAARTNISSLTVFRHPVGRVWSMFRFQTKACFKCKSLIDIYNDIDNGNIDEYDPLCVRQLQNHETANLLSIYVEDDTSNEDPNDNKLNNAKYNLQNFFTLIGLTEEIVMTRQMLGIVFPWLNETYTGSDTTCPLTHDNSSPSNNHCGKDNTHWELPSTPPDEIAQIIEQHNQLDLQLYETAVKQFQYQKLALGL